MPAAYVSGSTKSNLTGTGEGSIAILETDIGHISASVAIDTWRTADATSAQRGAVPAP